MFCCGVMLEWTALLSLCVCGSLVLEMKGFCWCVCIVLLVRSCISSVVLSVSSLRFGVSILLLVLFEFGRCFVSMVSSLVCVGVVFSGLSVSVGWLSSVDKSM